jgi:hypothetical protein
MKYKLYIISILFSFAIVNMSCLALKKDHKTLLYELETTSCYGTCPVYKMQIYTDGYVKLEGKEHLDLIGQFESSLSNEELDNLKEEFVKVSFFDLKNSYTSNFSDLQTKYITWYKDGQSKQIMAYDNIPKDLKALIKQLENLVKALDWKEIE